MRALHALLALAAIGPSTAVAATVTRGPYLQRNDSSSAIVVVELDEAAAVEIRYGDGQVARSAEPATQHEIALTGLQPDTRYDYAVWSGGAELSGGHALWTAVEPGSPFRFVLYGDTRTQPDKHLEAVNAILAEAPNLVVHTGDLVADGGVVEQWDEFFQIERPLLSQVPLFPAVGNHDDYAGDAVEFKRAFALPMTETFYSFDYGSAHFVMIDGHVAIESLCRIDDQAVPSCLDEEQRAWLDADLAAAVKNPDIEHIFVVTHIGPYSAVPSRDGSMQMRLLLDQLKDHGVTAVLSGHDHHYQRGEAGNGLPYMVSGGAGAPLYDIGGTDPEPHEILVEDKSHHYVVVDIVGDKAEITAKRLDGSIIDSVVLSARDPDCSRVDCDGTGVDPDPDPNPDPDPEPEPGGGCAASGGGLGGAVLFLGVVLALALRRRSGAL